METELRLAQYVTDAAYEDLPEKPIAIAKEVVLAVLGTTIAGANAEGCEALVRQVRQWGGRKEATILMHGGKVPAYNAALVNSAMARALDFSDGNPVEKPAPAFTVHSQSAFYGPRGKFSSKDELTGPIS